VPLRITILVCFGDGVEVSTSHYPVVFTEEVAFYRDLSGTLWYLSDHYFFDQEGAYDRIGAAIVRAFGFFCSQANEW